MADLRPIPTLLRTLALAAALHTSAHAQQTVVPERPDDAPGPSWPLGTSPPGDFTFGAYSSVQVNVNANGDNVLGDAANEPSIALDPTDPNSLSIGWRQFDTIVSNFREAGVAYTQDGGLNWTYPGDLEPGVFRSDPVLASDSQGNFYYLSITIVGPSFQCGMFVSGDGGVSWIGPFAACGGDKAWFTVDTTGGVGEGNIYQAWNIAGNDYFPNTFNRSVDGGVNWSTPIAIPDLPVFGTLDLNASGELYLAGTPGQDFTRIAVSKSSDARFGGASPTFATQDVPFGGDLLLGAGPNPGGLLGQIGIAVDRSGGATDGNVYMLACVDPPGADPLDVHFVRSTDGGSTWSSPLRLNDDAPDADSWQWFGTISVAPNGRIDAVWNDTRASGQENVSELYYAYSMDGGVIWSDNFQLTPAFDSHVGWPNQNKLGDYYDMISDEAGAHLAYAATFNGEQDVYYLNLFPDCNGNGVSDFFDIQNATSDDDNGNGVPDECELVLSQGAIVRGQPFELDASGFLAQGERVYFGYSRTGLGAGPCIFGGNLCLDLLNPKALGSAVVGPDGSVSLAVPVPPNAPLIQVHTQAVLRRPPGGAGSIKSNTLSDTIQP